MRLWPEAVYTWGSTPAERAEWFPCDRLMADAGATFYRGVDAATSAAAVYRWLCQLRVAPYSYDLIDNLGRRSPRRLTPGLEQLEPGQRMMTIFRLVEFEPERSITVHSRGSLFGEVACSYVVRERAPGHSRLVAKLLVQPRDDLRGLAAQAILAPGDLVMMRRQLLNLARLAEREPALLSGGA